MAARDMHANHHFEVDRALYLARMVDRDVTRSEVKRCVKQCEDTNRLPLHLHGTIHVLWMRYWCAELGKTSARCTDRAKVYFIYEYSA